MELSEQAQVGCEEYLQAYDVLIGDRRSGETFRGVVEGITASESLLAARIARGACSTVVSCLGSLLGQQRASHLSHQRQQTAAVVLVQRYPRAQAVQVQLPAVGRHFTVPPRADRRVPAGQRLK